MHSDSFQIGHRRQSMIKALIDWQIGLVLVFFLFCLLGDSGRTKIDHHPANRIYLLYKQQTNVNINQHIWKKKSEDNLMGNHNFRHIHNTFLIMIYTNKWRTPFPIFIKLSLFFVLGKCNSVLSNSTIRNDKQNWSIRPGLVCNKICSILSHFFLDFLLRSKYCQYFIILDQYHKN